MHAPVFPSRRNCARGAGRPDPEPGAHFFCPLAWASAGGVEENELCPVYVCRIAGLPRPDPAEVESVQWWDWARFRDAAADPDSGLSPWARLQVPLLDALDDPLLAA